jgi:hypothetical protein
MSQLVFQPALDPFHAVFRLIRLLPLLKTAGPLPIDHVRILDFYLLFPFRIRLIRLAQSHQHFKTLSEEYAHLAPYGEQPDPPHLFERMHPLQLAAIETLAANNYIDKDAFLDDTFKTSDAKVPEAIFSRAEELNAAQANLMEFIRTLAEHYTLSDGLNGLKARTGLMEYRYDAI